MPGILSPTNPKLEAVYETLIDDEGQFKYILCKVYDAEKPQESKLIIRGGTRYEFHSDIYDELDSQLEEYGLVCECLGGGKILHDPNQKRIEVFGKSQGYGEANHHVTVDILKKKYSDYVNIIWLNN
ncbi:hypothetical protein CAPTEDRAFT_152595 [Capitella teleta]|uniref:Uncharacterized protein n=1 Tax=Capitella teleta TaxID=283909 RepID=R7VI41_CAPTE|nr:hypothetical protein CAPTEDRAFT_152595 [Capitella teleta]|eukprot:ELU15976.1 hypothetical protein CAPTEDRAFT_152595 [Capitella teleta]